jgi:predicted amidohydrolase YtcJ
MDLIIYNAQIHTMDESNPLIEAFGVKDGLIRATGTNEEILKLKTEQTKTLNLFNKTVIPGLNDSHLHFYKTGEFLNQINLLETTSLKACLAKVKSFIIENKIEEGSWVIGSGWNQDYFTDENRFITKDDLDKITTIHPLVLSRACGHVIVANSKALEVCNIERGYQVEGGSVDYEQGLFYEYAIDLITSNLPEPSVEEVKETIIKSMKHANQLGVTSIQTDDFALDYRKVIEAYDELNKDGKLTCRINEQCLLPHLRTLNGFLSEGYNTGFGDHYFKIGPLKLIGDGSLGARTAALKQEYLDNPHNQGILMYEDQELYKLVKKAHTNNMQVAIHCIGNKAMHQALDVYERVMNEYPNRNLRHGIVHCQITDEILLNRLAKLNILAYVQPIFIHYDHRIVEKRVGEKLSQTSYAFKTMLNKKIHMSIGTDSPIEGMNPFNNIYCAVTRQDLNGNPIEGWNKSEALSVQEALYCYTVEPSHASFEEGMKGQITKGQFADFIVIDKDILTCPHNQIPNIKVEMTFVNGELVYQK